MKSPYHLILAFILGITILVILFFGPGLLVGFYAKRKNYNFWIWFLLSSAAVIVGSIIGAFYEPPSKSPYSIFSFILWSVVYMFLIFAPSKCPKCKRNLEKPEWKQKICPVCGEFGKTKGSRLHSWQIWSDGMTTLFLFCVTVERIGVINTISYMHFSDFSEDAYNPNRS